MNLIDDKDQKDEKSTGSPSGDLGRLTLTGFGWMSVATVFIALSLLQIAMAGSWFRRAPREQVQGPAVDPAAVLGEDAILPLNAEWQVVDFQKKSRPGRSIWGENSLTWTLQRGKLKVAMSLDYLFFDWHELSNCYSSSGWTRSKRKVMNPEEAVESWHTVTAEFYRPGSGERGLLFFDLFTRGGLYQAPPREKVGWLLSQRFDFRSLALFDATPARDRSEDAFQVQAFVVSEWYLSPEENALVEEAYQHFREQVYKRLTTSA